MVFFCTNGRLSGTFSNLLIPLQIGARDMAWIHEHISYWLFFISSVIMIVHFLLKPVRPHQDGLFTLH
jgi:cytochrome c oxidase subunit 1